MSGNSIGFGEEKNILYFEISFLSGGLLNSSFLGQTLSFDHSLESQSSIQCDCKEWSESCGEI